MEWLIILIIIIFLIFIIGLIFFWILDSDVTLWFFDLFGRRTSQLNGKVVWITGASSGIGEHLAYKLAKAGAKLILSGRNIERLQEVRNNCVTSGKTKQEDILCLPFDMALTEQHLKQLETALGYFSQIDILVNNAGRSQRALFHETDLRIDYDMFTVNVFATINLSRILLGHWIKNGQKGHFVVISSAAGLLSVPNSATYCATKRALHGYFESVRVENYSRGVSVSMICPGPVHSNLIERAFTGIPGVTHGSQQQQQAPTADSTDTNQARVQKKMKTSRCAHLISVAIVNQVNESWICQQPILTLYYFNQYAPGLCKFILPRVMTPEKMNKFREGTQNLPVEPSARDVPV